MKVQASIVLSFQAKTLTDAGAVLDDVLARARDREDVDLSAVELISPPGDRQVTLPPVAGLGHAAPPCRSRPTSPTGRSRRASTTSSDRDA